MSKLDWEKQMIYEGLSSEPKLPFTMSFPLAWVEGVAQWVHSNLNYDSIQQVNIQGPDVQLDCDKNSSVYVFWCPRDD